MQKKIQCIIIRVIFKKYFINYKKKKNNCYKVHENYTKILNSFRAFINRYKIMGRCKLRQIILHDINDFYFYLFKIG